ncbi:hypothetical protein BAE44_0000414 [Dichanthelium oligosanthes]|uniref:Uncharacterized protein n=1 Tax=Dichanthelium oligosanthes TaxID=888268 RepID=A0A1E5WMG3_9POAL|nr:hypothetical protein BAE44_0000414 [Dichanthelium oligosanthes]
MGDVAARKFPDRNGSPRPPSSVLFPLHPPTANPPPQAQPPLRYRALSRRSWEDLTPDLVDEIARCLPCLADRVRAAKACCWTSTRARSSFRSSSSRTRTPLLSRHTPPEGRPSSASSATAPTASPSRTTRAVRATSARTPGAGSSSPTARAAATG